MLIEVRRGLESFTVTGLCGDNPMFVTFHLSFLLLFSYSMSGRMTAVIVA